ncbi:hypothetical protein ACQ4PT_023211 [Festuca glaucescens]
MPPWAASLVLLLLILLHGRGGHGINLDMGAEVQMDSEAHRMLLSAASTGNRGYISYDALRGDAVPCSRPGVPYYNCRISKTANPYTRGCESITMCRDAEGN